MKTISVLESLLPGYEFMSQIGHGLGGETWLARGPQGLVAVKILSQRKVRAAPAFAQMLGEAMVLTTVKHPNVVPYLAFAHNSGLGVAALVMRYIDGGDLETYVAERGPFDAQQVAALGLTMVSALEALHGAGYLHRDLKPRNVLVERVADGPPVLYLADFGISQPLVDGVAQARYRALTPGYAAPEQWVTVHLRESVDIYGLGAVFWFMLTGRHPGEDEELPGPEHVRPDDGSEHGASPAAVQLCELLTDMMSEVDTRRPDLRTVRESLARVQSCKLTPRRGSTILVGMPPASSDAGSSASTISMELDQIQAPVGEPSVSAATRAFFAAKTAVWRLNSRTQDGDTPVEPDDATADVADVHRPTLRAAIGLGVLVGVICAGIIAAYMMSTPRTPPLTGRPVEAAAPPPKASEAQIAGTPPEPAAGEIEFPDGPALDLSEFSEPEPRAKAAGTSPPTRGTGESSTGARPSTAEAAKVVAEAAVPTQAEAAVTSATPAVEPPAAGQIGTLTVTLSHGWADVWIDDRRIDTTPLYMHPISAGDHVVRLTNAQTGLDLSKSVRVMAGRTSKVIFDAPTQEE